MSDLVPRGRREMTSRRGDVEVRPIGGSLRRLTGTDAQIAAYLASQVAAGVRVRLSESRRPGPGGTVIRVVELIPPDKRGPAPWWLVGAAILLGLAVLGAATIMGMSSLTHLVVAHPIAAIVGGVLIAAFGSGGITLVLNFGRR